MTNPKSQDLVSRLRALVALEKDATPGPWSVGGFSGQPAVSIDCVNIKIGGPERLFDVRGWGYFTGKGGGGLDMPTDQAIGMQAANATLLVALHNSTSDISKAADEIERLTKERDEFKASLNALGEKYDELEAVVDAREPYTKLVGQAKRKIEALEAQLATLTRPPSDEEVGTYVRWLNDIANSQGPHTAAETRHVADLLTRLAQANKTASAERRGCR